MSRFFPIDKGPRELKTDDLLRLKTIAEGWYCEYKREMVKTAAIAKSVSAFANTYGGWIFYGVEEDKSTRCANSAPGIPIAEIAQAEVRLRQAISGAISPAPYYEHVVLRGPLPELALGEDHAVIAAFVPQGVNAPYVHSSGRIYRRVYVAVAMGVPLITPVDVFRLNPEGNAPDETAKVYGPLPPCTSMVSE